VFELLIEQQGEPSLVSSVEETPIGPYYLSNLDQNIAVIVQTVYCFRAADDSGDEISACDVLREPMVKVLVYYYPLAGRLEISIRQGEAGHGLHGQRHRVRGG
jgi:omega-hydroxypalmitate O-feruloyl transferase